MSVRIIALICTVFSSLPFSGTLPRIQAAALEKENSDAERAPTLCYIVPPKGWDLADPKFLSKSVQIAFLKKRATGFCPSLNLAVEKVNVSLPEYLKAVKNIHENNHRNRWRQLGKVRTASGIGQLTEIDTTTEWGAVRMLQLILIKNSVAYVVTAAALKEEIAQFYKEFQTAFRTLQITADLVSTVPQMERREQLKTQHQQLLDAWQAALASAERSNEPFQDPQFQEKYWIPFQDAVVNEYEDMGAHWQVLMLKTTQEKMLALIPHSIAEETQESFSLSPIEDNASPQISDLLENDSKTERSHDEICQNGETPLTPPSGAISEELEKATDTGQNTL